jgi:hypothetical protein
MGKCQLLAQEHRDAQTQEHLLAELISNPYRHSVLPFAIGMLKEIGVTRTTTLLSSSTAKRSELERLGLTIDTMEPLAMHPHGVSDFGIRDIAGRRGA